MHKTASATHSSAAQRGARDARPPFSPLGWNVGSRLIVAAAVSGLLWVVLWWALD
ncbi:hypothetical protein dsx2_1638 [Desulfovibrio sp. X2]|uniref:hypothetical protein n=1 Tax=Desulfovibrio sp. X2 TaxID=941449 RepID=UPI000358B69F|nr:hypothetical protein [Desulfovibrio sp. X2]EPR44277.1 hypothetical protein dsx2_1638 [Desulfovibrio sp. X2]